MNLGPANAVVEKELESGRESESDDDMSAAVIEPPADRESAASLWSVALTNGQKLLGSVRAKDIDVGGVDLPRPTDTAAVEEKPGDEQEQSVVEEVKAIVETASVLRKFHHSEIQKELEDFVVRDSSTTPRIVVGFDHARKPLNTFDPEYWNWCFTELAPYGDCPERVWSCPPSDRDSIPDHPGVKAWYNLWNGHVPNTDRKWVESQITRADYCRWRLHKAFIAVASAVMLKRAQMRGLSTVVRRPYFKRVSKELDEVDCEDLLRTGQLLGDYASVKTALCHADVPNKVKTLLRQMQLAQQSIPYTPGYRRTLHRKFVAMRVDKGASVVFWTLNPADTKHTFTISFDNSQLVMIFHDATRSSASSSGHPRGNIG